MKREEYMRMAEEFVAEMLRTTRVKNADYSRGREDALDNFHTLAERASITPRQAWNCLFSKHLTAIEKWVKDGFVESEGIRGRFLDVAVYCMLGLALATDEEAKKSEQENCKSKRDEAAASRPPRWHIPADLYERLRRITLSVQDPLARVRELDALIMTESIIVDSIK